MPDWFYRTVSRPLLFALPAELSRSIAVGFMGRMGRTPFGMGRGLIRFLGHMEPDPRLATRLGDRPLRSSVGLAPVLDPAASAISAWEEFGLGFVEMGPIELDQQRPVDVSIRRHPAEQAVWMSNPGEAIPRSMVASNLRATRTGKTWRILRIRIPTSISPETAGPKILKLLDQDQIKPDFISIERTEPDGWTRQDWTTFLAGFNQSGSTNVPGLLLVIPSSQETRITEETLTNSGAGWAGVIVDGAVVSTGGVLRGAPAKAPMLRKIREIRDAGFSGTVIASGGIHQPSDAVEMLDAGANLLQIDTGLIYSGPGLCKRINEFLLARLCTSIAPTTGQQQQQERAGRSSWFWTLMLGVAMLLGSILALAIASTRVVLPYDEAFCGWNLEQMRTFNPKLPGFLTHDRVTLAGTMIAIGWLYGVLSWHGVRQGMHWARTTILISAGTGFFSFFLFLGFGYFDPFHGFVTCILFQLFAMAVHARENPPAWVPSIDPVETPAWRRAQWGLLLLVIHAVGLLIAGVVICTVGIGDVFVKEDLNYLQTTSAYIRSANPKLIPLVAHDRATLGGMLIAAGLIYLLSALWGTDRGRRWLWFGLLWAGLAAYIPAIGIHFAVGYIDAVHLLPAFLGMGLLLAGLMALREWMFQATGD